MPKATVRLPASLRQFVGGRAELTVTGGTVEELIGSLVEGRPGLAQQMLTPAGRLRSSVALYLNEDDIRNRQRERTRVRAGDVLQIVPAIAGGAGPRKGPKNAAVVEGSEPLSREEIRRYSRHLLLPEVGAAGQRRLRQGKVLLVGTGGLGAPAALYLAAAGVGELGLIDFDRVDSSNLQRQVLFADADVGEPKVQAAKRRLSALNPSTRVRVYDSPLTRENAMELLRPYDVIVDGTDNFPTRYLVNDACVLLGKPNVYGSVYRFEGQASVFDARRGPCYRCLYPQPPPPGMVPSCGEGGVIGVLPGLIGLVQATETIKLLLGVGEPLIGRLLLYDALALRFRELTLRKNSACVLCGPKATQKELIDYPAFCGVGAVAAVPEIAPEELSELLRGRQSPRLIDVREPGEWAIVHLAGAQRIDRSELAEHIDELRGAPAIVVYCKTGARSAEATRLLLQLGLTNVRNLAGGLDRYAERVDRSLPRY